MKHAHTEMSPFQTRGIFVALNASHTPTTPRCCVQPGLGPEARLVGVTAYLARPPDAQGSLEWSLRQGNSRSSSPDPPPQPTPLAHFSVNASFPGIQSKNLGVTPDFTHMPHLTSNPRARPVGCAFGQWQNLTPPSPSYGHSHLDPRNRRLSGMNPAPPALLQGAAAGEILLKKKSGPVSPPVTPDFSNGSQITRVKAKILEMANQATLSRRSPSTPHFIPTTALRPSLLQPSGRQSQSLRTPSPSACNTFTPVC